MDGSSASGDDGGGVGGGDDMLTGVQVEDGIDEGHM